MSQRLTVKEAVYIPYHHCTVEDMGWNMPDGVPDDWEYVEEILIMRRIALYMGKLRTL